MSATTTGSTVYKASGGRKFILTVALILLMPFLISLPIMLFFRIKGGLFTDAASLLVFSLIYVGCVAFLLFYVVQSYRTRIEIKDNELDVSVPKYRGPTPSLAYVQKKMPLDQIAAVETRGEVYRELAVPMLMKTASVVSKDGDRVQLGYTTEHSSDPAFPVPDIAEAIASKAGVEIKPRGTVKVGSQYAALVRGTAPWDDAEIEASRYSLVSDEQYARMKGQNRLLMIAISIILVGLVAVGTYLDVYAKATS